MIQFFKTYCQIYTLTPNISSRSTFNLCSPVKFHSSNLKRDEWLIDFSPILNWSLEINYSFT